MDFKSKYLKYKSKYFNLKKLQVGGGIIYKIKDLKEKPEYNGLRASKITQTEGTMPTVFVQISMRDGSIKNAKLLRKYLREINTNMPELSSKDEIIAFGKKMLDESKLSHQIKDYRGEMYFVNHVPEAYYQEKEAMEEARLKAEAK